MEVFFSASRTVAGANSVFYGDKLLVTPNADVGEDAELFAAIEIVSAAEFVQAAVE